MPSSVQLKLSLCARVFQALPSAADSCALPERVSVVVEPVHSSCHESGLLTHQTVPEQSEHDLKLQFGHNSKVNHYLYTDELHKPAAVWMNPFYVSIMRISHRTTVAAAKLFVSRSPHDESTKEKAGCSTSLCFLNIIIKQWLWI